MRLILFCLLILCAACKKDKVLLPAKALLVFPANNEVCATSTILSPEKSSIAFRWKPAENTDSYTITIKNLETGTLTTLTTDQITIDQPLDRNKPYSWFITSKNTKFGTEEKSETWKFYNPGPAVTSYSPFPADLLAPGFEEIIPVTTGTITLRWACSDADGDLLNYDVYLGTVKTPPLFKAGVTATSLADLTLERNKVYYWKITAIDGKGNKSNSDVYTFTLN